LPPIRSEPGLSCFGFAVHTRSGAISLLPWAVATPRAGGMPHVQVKHQEPRASEQCGGHTAGCCKPQCVWACGTPRGPSNVLPVPLPCVVHVLPAANARRRNKTTLDLSNASKNRLQSGVSYATQHALFNGRVCFPIDCKFCCMPRTNKRKKGKFALRSWRDELETITIPSCVFHGYL
jgi:hypothetical protein